MAFSLLLAACGDRSGDGGGSDAATSHTISPAGDVHILDVSDDGHHVMYIQRFAGGEDMWRYELYALETETGRTHLLATNDATFSFVGRAPQDDRVFYLSATEATYSLESWSPNRRETLAEGLIHAEHKPQFGVIIAKRSDSLIRQDWYSIDTATGEETAIAASAELKLESSQGRYLLLESNASGGLELLVWDIQDRDVIAVTDDPELEHPDYGFIAAEDGATHVWHFQRERVGAHDSGTPGTQNEQLWVRDLASGERLLVDELLVMQHVEDRSLRSSTRRIFWLSVREDSPADAINPRIDLKSWDGHSQTVRTLSEDVPSMVLQRLHVSDDARLAVYLPNQSHAADPVESFALAAYDFAADRETIISDRADIDDVAFLPGLPAVQYEAEVSGEGEQFRLWHAESDEDILVSHSPQPPVWLGVDADARTGAVLSSRNGDADEAVFVVSFPDLSVEQVSEPLGDADSCEGWLASDARRFLYAASVDDAQGYWLTLHDRQTGDTIEVGKLALPVDCDDVYTTPDLERGYVHGRHPQLPAPIKVWFDGDVVDPADGKLGRAVGRSEDWEHLVFTAIDEEQAPTGELMRFSLETGETRILAEQVGEQALRNVQRFRETTPPNTIALMGETIPELCSFPSARGECQRSLHVVADAFATPPTAPQQLDEFATEVLTIGEGWVLWVGGTGEESDEHTELEQPNRHLRFAKIR